MIAHRVPSWSSSIPHPTQMGTVGFTSPEQDCGDRAQLGPRSDVYSLGAVLFTLCTQQAWSRSRCKTDRSRPASCFPLPPYGGDVGGQGELACFRGRRAWGWTSPSPPTVDSSRR